MTPEEFAAEYEHLLPFLLLVDGQSDEQVTYFEALTALAYLWFADRPVGLGVYEVGMGGTWDATNLVAGDVAVIVPRRAGPSRARCHDRRGRGGEGGHHQGGEGRGRPRAARRRPTRVIEAARRRGRRRAQARVRGLRGGSAPAWPWAVSRCGCADCTRSTTTCSCPLFGEHAARNVAAAIAPLEALLGQALDIGAVRAGPRGPHVARPSRGRRPLAAGDPRRRAQPRRRRGAGRRDARVLHVGPAAPGAGRQREQGPRRASSRRSRPLADVAYAARNRSERSGEAERDRGAVRARRTRRSSCSTA